MMLWFDNRTKPVRFVLARPCGSGHIDSMELSEVQADLWLKPEAVAAARAKPDTWVDEHEIWGTK